MRDFNYSSVIYLNVVIHFGNSALHSVIFEGNQTLAATVLSNPAHGFMTC